ncbi:LURP-one-related/scramblase family protein [Alkalibacterium olivapovliticus]|uniref:Uncharacterized protein YxjI n=1 Tax=Alkalibacterium olivapovliticus TaxID=99907 RepID=A0A2T0WAD7_9LACT|nr:hypothetical protein [Alkalibacterium olivapovliticus]PRY83662.1 uncharacterized protein YxjI [Alkalibacterium olivapovliticus]
MVRLFIKKEYETIQDRMIVTTESGDKLYLIVGKWGRLGDKLSVYSMDGKRIVEARQVVLSVFPKFRLYQDGIKIGTIKKRPGLQGLKNPYFTVTRLNWMITGDYDKQIFTVRRFTKKILTIEKSVSFTGEFYILNFENETIAPVACLISQLLDHYEQSKENTWNDMKQEKYSLSFMHPVLMKLKKLIWTK